MQVREIRLNDAPAQFWEIARDSGPASVFYHPDLLDLWSNCYGWRSVLLIASESFLPGLVKASKLGSCFWSLPFGWYGGVFSPAGSNAACEALLTHLSQSKYAEISVVQFSEPSVGGMVTPGFQRRELNTHVLDLKGVLSYSENTQRNLLKAQAQEVQVMPLQLADIPTAMALLKEHERLTGKPRRIRPQFYEGLLRLGCDTNRSVRVSMATSASQMVACHIYLASESDTFYFDGFSSQVGRELSANFLLFDRVIRDSQSLGLMRLNFGASPEDDKGLQRFKESWGATPVNYTELYHASGLKRTVDKLRRRR
ncbi:MAG: GNAT family N-acetyltransferase [bacterium]